MYIIQRLFFFWVVFFVLLITGCSSYDSNEKQVIVIQEYADLDGGKYRDLENITDIDQVQQVREIVRDAKWEEKLVNMGRPADYRFTFQFENADIEAKPVLHELWISASSEKAEMIRGDIEYSRLNEKDTAALIEVLTGN
ncbi:hypothetical protein [[Bacillus] enclensis]|uniref:hypothetical protein n=1 Tax=[Bacillus] enclensis TaxID=1402860 RepID=UPI0018DB7CAA|nr:hypothetical protein [[Bacillus] enclensis]MBH9964941.1 hypothetical protein [[Bacillus] enclensis]